MLSAYKLNDTFNGIEFLIDGSGFLRKKTLKFKRRFPLCFFKKKVTGQIMHYLLKDNNIFNITSTKKYCNPRTFKRIEKKLKQLNNKE